MYIFNQKRFKTRCHLLSIINVTLIQGMIFKKCPLPFYSRTAPLFADECNHISCTYLLIQYLHTDTKFAHVYARQDSAILF